MSLREALDKIEECIKEQSTSLDLSELGLEHLPDKLFDLTWLTSLDLSSNQLQNISPKIAQLANLKILFLNHKANYL